MQRHLYSNTSAAHHSALTALHPFLLSNRLSLIDPGTSPFSGSIVTSTHIFATILAHTMELFLLTLL